MSVIPQHDDPIDDDEIPYLEEDEEYNELDFDDEYDTWLDAMNEDEDEDFEPIEDEGVVRPGDME